MAATRSQTVLLVLTLSLWEARSFAGPSVFRIALKDAERQALAASLDQQRIEAQIAASKEAVSAQETQDRPRLTLDGSYRYQSELPEASIGPMTLRFAEHNNYSVGPMLSYQVYDAGKDATLTKSTARMVSAHSHERDAARLKTILDTRQAYSRVQGSIEELRWVDESLRLVQSRVADIRGRLKAGSVSRLDLLSAMREEGQLKLRYAQAQSTLADGIYRLATLTQMTILPQPLIPAGRSLDKAASDIPEPNFILELDPTERTLQDLKQGLINGPNESHPSLEAVKDQIESTLLAAEALDKSLMPAVQVFAKSSYDYPNGPIDEKVWQNVVGLSLSLTLYDAGLQHRLSASKRLEAKASAAQSEQIDRDFHNVWDSSLSSVHNLDGQKTIVESSLKTVSEEARITTTNYRAGAATYLEVQRAQHQVLEVKTSLSHIKAQQIALLAMLNYLAADDGPTASESEE